MHRVGAERGVLPQPWIHADEMLGGLHGEGGAHPLRQHVSGRGGVGSGGAGRGGAGWVGGTELQADEI